MACCMVSSEIYIRGRRLEEAGEVDGRRVARGTVPAFTCLSLLRCRGLKTRITLGSVFSSRWYCSLSQQTLCRERVKHRASCHGWSVLWRCIAEVNGWDRGLRQGHRAIIFGQGLCQGSGSDCRATQPRDIAQRWLSLLSPAVLHVVRHTPYCGFQLQ